jgi:hypothetical protein
MFAATESSTLGFGIMDGTTSAPQYQHLLYPRHPCGGQQRSDPKSAPMTPALPPGLEEYNFGKEDYNAAKPTKAVVAPPPSSLPTPFGLKKGNDPKAMPAPKQDAARGNVVELIGLPKALMSKAMIETLVDQATSTKDVCVSDITLAQGKAYVSFAKLDDATLFIEHCHGRPWNPKGPPVSAMLQAPTKGSKKTKAQKSTAKANSGGNKTALPTAAGQNGAVELMEFSNSFAHVNNSLFKQMQYHAHHGINSETSTAVGDSDGEERVGYSLPAQPFKYGPPVHL